MNTYTVFYDAECAFCVRCRYWLRAQPALVRLNFVSLQTGKTFAELASIWRDDDELLVLGPNGEVYRGDGAFLVCLWALDEFREWSFRLSSPLLRPFARAAFAKISKNRREFSRWLSGPDSELVAELSVQPREGCDEGVCER